MSLVRPDPSYALPRASRTVCHRRLNEPTQRPPTLPQYKACAVQPTARAAPEKSLGCMKNPPTWLTICDSATQPNPNAMSKVTILRWRRASAMPTHAMATNGVRSNMPCATYATLVSSWSSCGQPFGTLNALTSGGTEREKTLPRT
jgi:hypothetical protein